MAGMVCLALSALAGAALAALAAAQEGEGPLSDREKAVHVLSRLAGGPRPGQIEEVLAAGVEAWIEEQLGAAGIDAAAAPRLASFQSLGLSPAELRDSYYPEIPDNATPEEIQRRNQLRRQPRVEMLQALLLRRLYNGNQLYETLCDFWRNHFNVSYTKGGPIDVLITSWERDVIQAHALGSFGAMLRATARHPAMLYYLDNHLSRRPPTKQELAEVERRARRRTGSRERAAEEVAIAEQKGLNENYARELLELHTLGVDNDYEQKDVIAVAEVLTGWTYSGGRYGSWEFQFHPQMHVEGDKRVLGKVIRGDRERGADEGEQVLELLAGHRGTARFLATKLVRYLVNDQPPPKLVEKVAAAYEKSDGAVAAMVRAVVESEEFWSRDNYRAKFKTPLEFVVSCLRATGAEIEAVEPLLGQLRDMGQPLYHCDDPTGYYDTAEAWLDPGVMALRWQFALDLAEGKLRGVKVPASFYEDLPEDLPARLWQHHLTLKILPGGAGERTRAALSSVTDEYLARRQTPDLKELGPQLLGLLLGSPEFQQQ